MAEQFSMALDSLDDRISRAKLQARFFDNARIECVRAGLGTLAGEDLRRSCEWYRHAAALDELRRLGHPGEQAALIKHDELPARLAWGRRPD